MQACFKPKPHPRHRDSPGSCLDAEHPAPVLARAEHLTQEERVGASGTTTDGEVNVTGHWSHRVAELAPTLLHGKPRV